MDQVGVETELRGSDDRSYDAGLPRAVRAAAGSEEAFHQLVAFAALLAREGETRGLIGPREIPRLWSRHIVNSLAINDFVPEGATVADIGSGAGFPGVVLAITRPDVTVALIDSMERRTEWLEHVRVSLGLKNVVVVTNRAESLRGHRRFDVVTARAVAPMDRLVRWALPLVRSGGRLVALKGQRALEELLTLDEPYRSLDAVRSYAWLLQEYRVSVFAQHLGTVGQRHEARTAAGPRHAAAVRRLVKCPMRRADEMACLVVEELAGHPVQFCQHMTTFVQIGMRLTVETNDESRNFTTISPNAEAKAFPGIGNFSTGTDQA